MGAENPCHRCGFFWGCNLPAHAHAQGNPYCQPAQVHEPEVFPIYDASRHLALGMFCFFFSFIF